MARGKKNEKFLTQEEKLVQALVPVDEQPYEVPENWCWTTLGFYIDYATDYVANGSFASLKKNVNIYKEENYALMVKTADFANDFTKSLTYTDKQGYDYLSKSVLYGGELILSNIGSIGKVFRVPFFNRPMTLASNSVMIKCHRELDYDWLYYFFLSPIGFEELMAITTGTAVLKFNKTDLKTILLPVPPLAEQQRIVDRIESLFAKLDEAKEKAQAVVDGFEDRKAAILHKAFTGKLSQEWRNAHETSSVELFYRIQEHISGIKKKKIKKVQNDSIYALQNKKPQEWLLVDLDSISTLITDGEHKTPNRVDTFCGYYLLSARNVLNDALKLDDVDYIDKTEYGVLSKRCNPKKGDILLSCSGSVGRCCVINDDNKYCMVRSAAMISTWGCNSRFIMYMLQSDAVQEQIRGLSKQTAQANLFIGAIASLAVPLPSKEEQNIIVEILDRLFELENNAKEMAQQVIDQIVVMKKSILARAFRGELGTNDPADESAEDLLKRIL